MRVDTELGAGKLWLKSLDVVPRWTQTQVYTCGECGKEIQGTVSTVQHLLAHDSDGARVDISKSSSTLVNGGEHKNMEHVLHNGISKREINSINRSVLQGTLRGLPVSDGTRDERTQKGGGSGVEKVTLNCIVDGKLLKIGEAPVNIAVPVAPVSTCGNVLVVENGKYNVNVLDNGNVDEHCIMQSQIASEESAEINPLDLLTTVLEEDQKSDNPLLPAEHFLLSLPTPTHFLDNESGIGGQDDSADGYQESQENDDDASNDGSDIPSDILLDHPGVYQCDKCPEAFKYQYLLVSHKRQAHQGQSVQFQCQVCQMEFAVLQELKRHMMTHSGANMYACHMCGQGFSDRPSLKAHILTHGGSAERSSKCESCAVEFMSKSELTRHIVKYQGTCNPQKSSEFDTLQILQSLYHSHANS
ncbi:hypothetical protein SK128_024539 [Halocaridina rubra]|uniref:C2H2-type domain-containing protein n=1 Tax=Halocaridina rubra TaxID=373956 RepID=A0AAN8X8L0_HALRR